MMHHAVFISSDRRALALLTGAAIGALGALFALLIVLAGPVMAFGALIGLAGGLYILSSLDAALYGMFAVIALLPFANFPFSVGLTPTLLDGALGAFLLVYVLQWMSGRRRLLRSTPLTPIVLLFIGIMLLAFLLGLRHAPLTARVLRNVLEMVLSLLLIPVLIDVMRDADALRRAVRVLILTGALAGAVGIALWLLPDLTAEAMLNRLGRLGYPVGGVIRYRQTSAALLNERAIGTWVDPNAFGGFLVMIGALAAPQVFARRPVLGRRAAIALLGVIGLALFLTDSRGSVLALGMAFVFIAALRYRRLLAVMALAGVLMLFMPFTQRYVEKFEAGVRGEDVETQMRFGEYQDALNLIARYPLIGVGFSGTPQIDLYLGVASTYLTIASSAGIAGLAGYLLVFASAFGYSAQRYARIRTYPDLSDVWLGLAAALVGVLVGGFFDHFYFKIDQFHAAMTAEWSILGLMVAAARLAAEPDSYADGAASAPTRGRRSAS